MNDDETAGFRDRFENGVVVDRRQRGHIDDFAADAATFELLRRAQRLDRHGSPRDERDVGSFAQPEADVERQSLAVVGDFLLDQPVQADGLEKHHGVRVADRREQQPVRAGRRRRTHHAQPRMMSEQGFQALGVVLRGVNTAAVRHAHHERAGEAPARAVAHAGHVIADLIQGGIQESHELNLRDRPQALGGHAYRHAGDHALGQRSVLHTVLAELLLKACGGAEHAAVHANVLSEHHHGWIAGHFPRVRAVDGFDHRHFCHERVRNQSLGSAA